jgi:hypothetical protein
MAYYPPPSPLVAWRHPDGRRILVYPDRQVRLYRREHRSGAVDFVAREASAPRREASAPRREADYLDEWPILYRRDVPTLTDAEWQASPGEGWFRVGHSEGD